MRNKYIEVIPPEAAALIKKARLENGLTQERLSKISGVFQSEISRLEKVHYVPRAGMKAEKIFAVLGLKHGEE